MRLRAGWDPVRLRVLRSAGALMGAQFMAYTFELLDDRGRVNVYEIRRLSDKRWTVDLSEAYTKWRRLSVMPNKRDAEWVVRRHAKGEWNP